jgi:hypothetical protein
MGMPGWSPGLFSFPLRPLLRITGLFMGTPASTYRPLPGIIGLSPGSSASPEAHRPLLTDLSTVPSAPREVALDVSHVKAPPWSCGTSWEAAPCGSLVAGILENFLDVVNTDKVLPAEVHGGNTTL